MALTYLLDGSERTGSDIKDQIKKVRTEPRGELAIRSTLFRLKVYRIFSIKRRRVYYIFSVSDAAFIRGGRLLE